MMNREQAVAYGKRTGCKYYVKNSRGGLLGGFKTIEAAEACKAREERSLKTNPFMRGVDVKVFITTEV